MNIKKVNQKQDSSSRQDWQISKLTSVERAKHLLETGLHADCKFLVGDGLLTAKEFIKAHQIFLAMSSPVFEAMFYGKMTQSASGGKNEPIPIPDLTPSSFRDLLQYIYTDSLILLSMGQAICLCYAAKKYILPDLVAKCARYMLDNLSTAHICRVLEFSKLINDEYLKTKCLTMLREKTRESLMNHSGFEDLSESTVLSIVKDDALTINELELFDAVVRWAKHQCTQRGYGINRTAMRHMLGDLINEIRFLSMTSGEFASSPVLSGILEEKECMAIFMNLNNPGSLPMPIHLSSCQTKRERAADNSSFTTSSLMKNGERSTKHNGIYCLRQLLENKCFVLKEPTIAPLSLCSTTLTTSFTVNQDITIKGFVIAQMVLDDLQVLKGQYMLEIECHLLDHRYSKVASAINRGYPPWTSHPITLEAVFEHSIRVKRNMKYRISISFNRRSHFLLGMASPDVVSCQGVQFHFSTDDRDKQGDLIRGVIFDL